MINNQGYIKLYRSLINWEWYTDSNTKSVFIHCLLKANYEDKKWQGIHIERGSFVTSIRTLAQELKLTNQNVRTSINKLKNSGEINTQPTNKFTVIKIVNYNNYQGFTTLEIKNKNSQTNKLTNEQLITNTQPTHKVTTTKEVNKERNKEVNNREIIYMENSNTKEYEDHSIKTQDIKNKVDNITKIDYEVVVEHYNQVCKNLPKVRSITEIRKKNIRNLYKNIDRYNKDNFSTVEIVDFFQLVEDSDFLTGRSGKWCANFDWIIKAGNVFKILEGNYVNKLATTSSPYLNKQNQRLANRIYEDKKSIKIVKDSKEKNLPYELWDNLLDIDFVEEPRSNEKLLSIDF